MTLQQPASAAGVVLITGATDYIGGRLVPALEGMGVPLRCLARKPAALASRVSPATDVVAGDLLVTDPTALTTFPVRPVGLRDAIGRAILASLPEHRHD